MYQALLFGLVFAGLAACGDTDHGAATDQETDERTEAAAQIDTERLSEIVKILASDEFEGRAPGTPGDKKTVEYLIDQFAQLGLEPGRKNGSWVQTVPLIHTRVQVPAAIEFKVGAEAQTLQQQTDIEVSTVRPIESIAINAPVVFVGFGA